MPYLSKIIIYPIKSLDGVELAEATLLPGGALRGDREFALFDRQGTVVNAKRTAHFHRIRAQFDLSARTITLSADATDTPQTFHLDGDRPALENWFSQALGEPVTLRQNNHGGFPDDVVASGPTVVSTATLATVASWFPTLTLEDVRRRFRANLEIEDAVPFWEDQLFGEPDEKVPFQVGRVTFMGCYPCQRCIVPTRDALTGDRTPHFQQHFSAQRKATLPPWANPSRFNHFYRLTLNTVVSPEEAGKTIQLGDVVSSLGISN